LANGREAKENRMLAHNKNGVILHEGSDVVVIATGLAADSQNTKTGGMVQVYILMRELSPIAAVNTGADIAICGECHHRGVIVNNKVTTRRCYVNLGQGPRSVWSAYTRGRYRHVTIEEYLSLIHI
jgi:hypothetical protein